MTPPYKIWSICIRGAFLIVMLLTIFNFWYVGRKDDYYNQYIFYTNELRVSSQRISKHSIEAVTHPQKNIFDLITNIRDQYSQYLDILENGLYQNGKEMLPPSPEKIKNLELKVVQNVWDQEKERINTILSNQDIIIEINHIIEEFDSNLHKINDIYWEITKEIAKNTIVTKVFLLAETMRDVFHVKETIDKILDIRNTTPANELNKELSDFLARLESKAQEVEETIGEPKFNANLMQIRTLLRSIQGNVQEIFKTGEKINQVQSAALGIYDINVPFLDSATALALAYAKEAQEGYITKVTGYILSTLSVLLLAGLLYLFYKENQYSLEVSKKRNKDLEEEVSTLINEIKDVATGNLAVKVTISTGVTKHIAQSVNYTLNALRKLISNINKTTQNTSQVLLKAQKITKNLAIASERQEKEINNATASVQTIVNSIEEVSSTALQSEAVALDSVKIAHEGVSVVNNTIVGMQKIQTQIQEMSEKIKRLSDGSQEIGEIVALIDGIAEQTNILSLNAAIQAAMAGEAGKGFGVVADEVQQLAEKASYATREISSLVRSIQTDTLQVITAMEQTRTEVLEGAKLAKNAGQSLENIEQVSEKLATLIKRISDSSRTQAILSTTISEMMDVIKEITKTTAGSSVDTNALIVNLTQLVDDLCRSIAEFRLGDKK